jgi:hypothetical protein
VAGSTVSLGTMSGSSVVHLSLTSSSYSGKLPLTRSQRFFVRLGKVFVR